MSKTTPYLKDNTFNTFYTTQINSFNDTSPFSIYKRHFQANTDAIDKLSIEAETLLHKLAQKISLDESKIQRNFAQISQIAQQIEQMSANMQKEKQIDNLLKVKKDQIKHLCSQKKQFLQHSHKRCFRQSKNFSETLEQKERQLQSEKQSREECWSSLIDEFQKEINKIEHQFKELRSKDDQVFEQNSIGLYNLEHSIKQKLENQNQTRKKQHQMVVRLVSECIENIRYAY